jgi:stage V sporulation protein SpoVS
MGLLDILKQYADPAGVQPDRVGAHFDEVAQQSNPNALSGGLAAAFRSDATPPFGETVGQLFAQSDPQQRAGILNQILQSAGPSVLASLGGGVLGRVLGGANVAAGTPPTITPAQASQVSPADASAIAAHAEKHDSSIIDMASAFYAQHPTLVKSLGASALAIVLGQMHSRS